MSKENFSDFQDKNLNFNLSYNFLFIGDGSFETKSPFNSNDILGEENYSSSFDCADNLSPYNYEENSNKYLNEENDVKNDINFSSFKLRPIYQNFRNDQNSLLKKEKKAKKALIFKIDYCPKNSLFTKTKVNNILVEEEKENRFINRKRTSTRRKRMENKDNIRKKIKRGFLNYTLIKKLNEKLKKIGSKTYFEKFPQFFSSDVDQKRNKKILNMILGEIFNHKELYVNENKKGLDNFKHNLKVIQSEEIQNSKIFKNILNKTFMQLYEEYLNSNEFNIYEINRLKESNMDDAYIRRYKEIAKDLMKFFCN